MKAVEKICQCGVSFFVKSYKAERSKFCSNKCKYKFYVKATGFRRVDKKPNPNWFVKEQLPWNTGTKGVVKSNSGSIKVGQRLSPLTEFSIGENIGKENNKWKGDDVGYYGLHTWVQRTLGKAEKCSICGETKKRIDWANRSRQYMRDIDDWLQLCSTCHGKYDTGHRGAIKMRFGKCA